MDTQVLAQETPHDIALHLQMAMEVGNVAWWEMELPSGLIRFDANKTKMIGADAKNFKHYKDFTDLVHPEDYPKIMKAMMDHLQGLKEVYETEYRIKHTNGNYRWFYDRGRIIKKGENGYFMTMGVVQDITDLKESILLNQEKAQELAVEKASVEKKVIERTQELHNEHAKLKGSIESIPVGFLIIDKNNQVTMRNPAIERLLNIDSNNEISLEELARKFSDQEQVSQQIIDHHSSNTPFEVKELPYSTRIFHLIMSPILYENDANQSTALLLEDITEETIISRSKDEFFSIASHELRTPLTAIKGNTSMMLDSYKSLVDTDSSFKEMVLDIHNSADHLIAIVNDFLDVSRAEQGKLSFKLESIDLIQIVKKVFDDSSTSLQGKNLELKADYAALKQLPMLSADKTRLGQVITNLIKNSIKFTENGEINLSASVDGNFAKVMISDTGQGIPTENQKLLFHKFQQAAQNLLTRDPGGGTGLGLYLSKILVEGMGGKIGLVHSEVGAGTTFYFTVPISSQVDNQKQYKY